MNNALLKSFFENEPLREAVREFQIQCLKEMAVDRVFEKRATAGIYEGKKAIDASFDKLDELYGIIPPVKMSDSK